MNNPSSIFSDNASTEQGDVNEKCPCCKSPYSEHTDNQLVACALTELKGGKN